MSVLQVRHGVPRRLGQGGIDLIGVLDPYSVR